MNIDKKTRLELNALSLEVFGSSSRWQKLITKGYEQVDFEKVMETVPAEKEGEPETQKEATVPVSLGNNSYKQTIHYQTIDTIKDYMLDRQKQIQEIKEKILKMQADAQAKKKAESLNEEFGGSVQ